MPPVGSKLVPFLLEGLNKSEYPNLIWINKKLGIFQLTFAKYDSRGPWQEHELILKAYEGHMKRPYEGYSKARGTISSAVKGSKYLETIAKVKHGRRYRIKDYTDVAEEKQKTDKYASDGESVYPSSPDSVLSVLSPACSSTVLADHCYGRNGSPRVELAEHPIVSPPPPRTCADIQEDPLAGFHFPASGDVPTFEDIEELIRGDQSYQDYGNECTPAASASFSGGMHLDSEMQCEFDHADAGQIFESAGEMKSDHLELASGLTAKVAIPDDFGSSAAEVIEHSYPVWDATSLDSSLVLNSSADISDFWNFYLGDHEASDSFETPMDSAPVEVAVGISEIDDGQNLNDTREQNMRSPQTLSAIPSPAVVQIDSTLNAPPNLATANQDFPGTSPSYLNGITSGGSELPLVDRVTILATFPAGDDGSWITVMKMKP